MRIKIGLCLTDTRIPNSLIKDLSPYEILLESVLYKIRYIKKHIDRLYCIGAEHVRLPTMLPTQYDDNDFNQLLKDRRFILEVLGLNCSPVSFSFHAPYWSKTCSKRQREQLRRYLIHTKRIMEVIGIKEYTIVCHVNDKYVEGKLNKMCMLLNTLPIKVRRHVVIENDERVNNLEECLEISKIKGCPVVFDNLHHKINNRERLSYEGVAKAVKQSWDRSGSGIKIHYSNGDRTGKHLNYIDTEDLDNLLIAFSKHHKQLTVVFEIGSSQDEISYIHLKYPEGVVNCK